MKEKLAFVKKQMEGGGAPPTGSDKPEKIRRGSTHKQAVELAKRMKKSPKEVYTYEGNNPNPMHMVDL